MRPLVMYSTACSVNAGQRRVFPSFTNRILRLRDHYEIRSTAKNKVSLPTDSAQYNYTIPSSKRNFLGDRKPIHATKYCHGGVPSASKLGPPKTAFSPTPAVENCARHEPVARTIYLVPLKNRDAFCRFHFRLNTESRNSATRVSLNINRESQA